LLKHEVGRLQHELVFCSTRILGAGAVARAEYLIIWLKPRHVLAERLNVPCHIESRNIVPSWFEQPDNHAHADRHASHGEVVTCVEGSRVNAYQHVASLTTGLSTSLSSRTSGEPYLFWTIAFIAVFLLEFIFSSFSFNYLNCPVEL
jgi:hypothetical protein